MVQMLGSLCLCTTLFDYDSCMSKPTYSYTGVRRHVFVEYDQNVSKEQTLTIFSLEHTIVFNAA